MTQLQSTSDVVCLFTERSLDRPWILFEAGVAKGSYNAFHRVQLQLIETVRKRIAPDQRYDNNRKMERSGHRAITLGFRGYTTLLSGFLAVNLAFSSVSEGSCS